MLGYLMASATVLAQSQTENKKMIDGRTITIEVYDDSTTDLNATTRNRFTKACESFSVYLTQNRGLWASGPFTRAQCNIQSSPNNQKKTGAMPTQNETSAYWKLKATSTGVKKRFEIFFQNKKGDSSQQAIYEFDSEIPLVMILEKSEFAQLMAAYLTNSLPIRTAVTGKALTIGNRLTITGRSDANINMESRDAEIYQIKRAGDVWLTRLVGTASISKRSGRKTQINIESLTASPLDDSPMVRRQSIYFIHQLGDRQANQKRIDDALKSRMGTFFSKFLNIGRSAYLGARYGVPLQKGAGVLANVSLLGIFGEFRGGILSGLRLNYDAIPKQKVKTEEHQDEFSWSRFQLGYGFGIKLDNPILNWIDFSPKLGVTNLILTSTSAPDAATEGYEFKLQRAPTVGLEIGLEKRTNAFLIRLWGYGSYSLGVLPIDKEYKSTSIRAGIDLYRELIDWRRLKLAILVFTAADQNQYTRLATTEELTENPNMTTQVKFGSFFGGGGLTLTW